MSPISDNPAARPTGLIVLSLVGAFASGPLIGISLARMLAPQSFVADAVGMFAFPLAFAFGLQAWLGFAIFGAVVHLVRRALAGQPLRAAPPAAAVVPPGAFVFVPLAIGAGLLAGLVIGVVSDSYSVLSSTAILGLAGALYGGAVWQLARAGYLPFPEPA